MLPNFALG